ncbi:hypothetical protein P7C70_g7419, partial [Phenoliferia sp. Uapishka_3]
MSQYQRQQGGYERQGSGYEDYAPPAPSQQVYPPHSYQNNYMQSSDSLAEVPLAAGAGYGATEKMNRDANNPFASNYKGEGGSGKKKWIIGGIALVVVAIVVGVAVGVVESRKSTSNNAASSSGDTGNSTSTSTTTGATLEYISGTAKVVKSNPKDPSDFEKDSKLHNVFYGMAYTPFNAQAPECGATLANVTEDIQLLSQLTTRLRMCMFLLVVIRATSLSTDLGKTDGTACNQSQLVLQAIQDTKVNMTVWLGAYIGSNTTVNAQQQQDVTDALNAYGATHVSGVMIGNEVLLDSTDLTASTTLLVAQMKEYRTKVNALGLGKTIPVGTGDAGSMISAPIAAGADFFMANVHPFFGGLLIDQAAAWTTSYFDETDVIVCNAASNDPTCYIGETGWPSNSLTAANLTDEGAVAGVPELQTFLDTYVCQANANASAYFFFSPFDEPWCYSRRSLFTHFKLILFGAPFRKDIYGGVEPFWGLGDSNKVWKNITFPSC